jgi:multidrug efflux system membrane fusion protein
MKRYYWFILLVILLLGIYLYSHRILFTQKSADKSIPVSYATVVKKDITPMLDSIGQVLPLSTVSITPQVSGRLLAIYFKEGDLVKEGQPLFEIDPRPYQAALSQAEAQYSRDQSQLWNAKLILERSEALKKKGFLSSQDYDQVKSNAESLAATVKADEALINQAKLNLEYCKINSPVTGRTGNFLITIGNTVTAGTNNPLVIINQIQPIYISFTLPEKELSIIQSEWKKYPILISAFSNNNFIEQGKLAFINNTIDTTTGTIQLKAIFENKNEKLWPGQFSNIQLPLQKLSQVLVVPTEAVQIGQQGNYVYIINPDNTVTSKIVSVGLQAKEGIVIQQGLEVGNRVVTSGQLKLRDGLKVKLQ